MKYFICILALFAATACRADTDCDRNEFGDLLQGCEPPDETTDVYPGFVSAGKVPLGTWELTLIKVNRDFVDLNEPDWRFRTRVDCIRDGIYRMERSLEMMNHVQRKDNGEIALTYTQYLGFICEEVEIEETGE